MKILAIHGMWSGGYVFDEFKKYFLDDEVIAIDVEWHKFDPKELAAKIQHISPEAILAYSFGGYAIQKIFDVCPGHLDSVKKVILLAPVGPRGLGVKSFLKLSLRNIKLFASGLTKGTFEIPEEVKTELGIEFLLVPESRKAVMMAMPFAGNVVNPIRRPILIISGGKDVFVSKQDAERIAKFHKVPPSAHIHLQKCRHDLLNEGVATIIGGWLKK